MADNKIRFDIEIKDVGSGALRTVSVAAKNADEAIGKIAASASAASGGLRRMADVSIMLDAGVRSIQTLQNVIGGAVSQFNSFDTAMRRANTMALQSGEAYDRLRGQIVSMSKEIPLVRDELANGLYETISNGVPENNWISFLDRSARAAAGGCADLSTTVGTTATIIKTYSLAWDQAQAVQDRMQMTAKKGKTSIAELGQALPRVSGSAAQLGVQLDELMAVFATTTGVTGNTSEVSTQLAAVLNSLIKPTSEASKMAAAMGISFDAASVKAAGGFSNFLELLDESVQSYATSSGMLSETIYGQLFGSAEALRLLGSLTGAQKDTFVSNIEAMADSTGAIDEAFEIMAESNDSFAQKLNNSVAAMTDWLGAASKSAGPILAMAANSGQAILSIMQLTKGMNLAKTASAAWAIVQKALNIVLSANPIGLVVWAIAALVAGIIYAYNHSESFRRICDQLWAVIKKVAAAVWDFLVAAFEKVTGALKAAWEWLVKFFGFDTGEIKGGANAANDAAKAITGAGDAAKNATPQLIANAKSYEELTNNINYYKSQLKQLKPEEESRRKEINANIEALKKQRKELAKGNRPEGEQKYDGSALIANAKTYKELGNNVKYYQDRLDELDPAETDRMRKIVESITALQKQQEAIKATIAAYEMPEDPQSMADINKAISVKKAQLQLEPDPGNQIRINREIEALERKLKVIEIRLEAKPLRAEQIIPATPGRGAKIDLSKYGVKLPDLSKVILPGADEIVDDETKRKKEQMEALNKMTRQAQQGLRGVSDMLISVSGLIGESAGAWLQWGASVLDACSRALPAIMAVAGANAANSAAQTPIVGWLLAGAAVASVLASFAALPKFAEGGLAYGPTLGLFGEYAGAKNNPEVVAPLNRLKALINPAGGAMSGKVEFEIDGRKLHGVLRNVEKYNDRTR